MQVEEIIATLTDEFRIHTRAKLKQAAEPSAWATWFLMPVPGYIEASSYGPVPRREIEWIELDPVEQRLIGRLVPLHHIDHTPQLLQHLAAQEVRFQLVRGRIRISIQTP
jgi:hypothetical protein